MEQPIKILYFVDRMLRGGIQSLLIDWVSRFDKTKISVDFLLLDDGNDYELENTLKKLGCNVYKLKGIWINNPFDFVKEATALDIFFKEHHNYQIIHMHSSSKNYLVLKYAQKYGIPTRISHSHNTDYQTNNRIKKIIGDILKKKLIKYSTDYFACSVMAGEWMFGKDKVSSGKVKIIHNAVDYKKFKYNENIRKKIRNEFNIKNNEILIGNVGRFVEQKNHSFLIDVFNEIHRIDKDTKLILVGSGGNEDLVKNKVKELGLTKAIIFTGFRNDVNMIMQAMDVFLMPSLYEGLPVVGVEAQAAGLPCFMSKDVITKEVQISNCVHFISLDSSAREWAKTILNSNLNRVNNEKQLKENGYMIEDTILDLTYFYINK